MGSTPSSLRRSRASFIPQPALPAAPTEHNDGPSGKRSSSKPPPNTLKTTFKPPPSSHGLAHTAQIPGLSWELHPWLQLTSPGRLLGQLQAIDGEAIDPTARVAPLPLAFHVALRLAGVGCLDLVPTVALGTEFQPCIEVSPGKREMRGAQHIPRHPPGSMGFCRSIPAAAGSHFELETALNPKDALLD